MKRSCSSNRLHHGNAMSGEESSIDCDGMVCQVRSRGWACLSPAIEIFNNSIGDLSILCTVFIPFSASMLFTTY